MHWNNRLVKDKSGEITVREAYYNDKNELVAYNKDPIAPIGDSLEEIKGQIEKIFIDISTNQEIIDEATVKFAEWEGVEEPIASDADAPNYERDNDKS
jgi:hypothetical protein